MYVLYFSWGLSSLVMSNTVWFWSLAGSAAEANRTTDKSQALQEMEDTTTLTLN